MKKNLEKLFYYFISRMAGFKLIRSKTNNEAVRKKNASRNRARNSFFNIDDLTQFN